MNLEQLRLRALESLKRPKSVQNDQQSQLLPLSQKLTENPSKPNVPSVSLQPSPSSREEGELSPDSGTDSVSDFDRDYELDANSGTTNTNTFRKRPRLQLESLRKHLRRGHLQGNYVSFRAKTKSTKPKPGPRRKSTSKSWTRPIISHFTSDEEDDSEFKVQMSTKTKMELKQSVLKEIDENQLVLAEAEAHERDLRSKLAECLSLQDFCVNLRDKLDYRLALINDMSVAGVREPTPPASAPVPSIADDLLKESALRCFRDFPIRSIYPYYANHFIFKSSIMNSDRPFCLEELSSLQKRCKFDSCPYQHFIKPSVEEALKDLISLDPSKMEEILSTQSPGWYEGLPVKEAVERVLYLYHKV